MSPFIAPALLLVACEPSAHDSEPVVESGPRNEHAIVLKAAGYLPGEGPPDDVDAISEATTATWNTHEYADRLRDQLEDRGREAQVVDFVDCKDLSCLLLPSGDDTAAVVVFAGPTHWGVMADPLQGWLALLPDLDPLPELSSAITSCETLGEYAVDSYLVDLTEAGVPTVPGVAFVHSEANSDDVDASLSALVDSLTAE